jgi:uncharacterized protein (TIGR03437 family)
VRFFLVCVWLLALSPAGAAPQSLAQRQLSAHYFDVGSAGATLLLAADGNGAFFMVSRIWRGASFMSVSKLDDSGNILATYDLDDCCSLPFAAAVDPSGNLAIAGTTFSSNFPLISPLQTSGSGFMMKLDSQLHGIIFSTRIGNSDDTSVTGAKVLAIAFDPAGNMYLTGTVGPGLPVTESALQPQPPDLGPYALARHGFVIAISAAGDKLLFSTYFTGGAAQCAVFCGEPPPARSVVLSTSPSAIAVDSSGAVIISGSTNVTDLPVTSNAYASQCGCDETHAAGFIAKIAAAGTKLTWGTYLPLAADASNRAIFPSSMALDSSGNILLAGDTLGGLPTTPDAIQPSFPPSSPAPLNPAAGFLAKLDGSGSTLLYGSYFGGNAAGSISRPAPLTGIKALAIDQQGTIWLTGGSAPEALPPAASPVLGQSYLAALSADAATLAAIYTAPEGATGNALAVSSRGAVATLGLPNSLLLAKNAVGPSVLGVAELTSYRISQALSARELVSIYGIGIGPESPQSAAITDGVISNSLGGVQVLFNGKPAALLYAGPTQINAIVPNLNQQNITIRIVTPSGMVDGPTLGLVSAQPEVFTDIGGHAAALNEDGTLNSALNPAPRGSAVSVWMTGAVSLFDAIDNRINTSLSQDPTVSAVAYFNSSRGGFQPLDVLYAGDAPLLPSGVTQVNFRVPASLPPNWIVNGQLKCYIVADYMFDSEMFTIYVR